VTAFILAWFPAMFIPAIVLGIVALNEIDDSHGTQRGRGLASWAIFLGVVSGIVFCIILGFFIAAVADSGK